MKTKNSQGPYKLYNKNVTGTYHNRNTGTCFKVVECKYTCNTFRYLVIKTNWKKCLVISSIDLLRSRVICIGCFVLLQLWELRCWQKENFLVQPITEWLWPMRGKGFGHSICVIMLLCIFIEIGTRFVTPGF